MIDFRVSRSSVKGSSGEAYLDQRRRQCQMVFENTAVELSETTHVTPSDAFVVLSSAEGSVPSINKAFT
jgi:hypothetical protein